MSSNTLPPNSNPTATADSHRLSSLVAKYLEYEKVAKHKAYIEKLVQQDDYAQLERLVGKRLAFGTAGIRGAMGPGFAQMNDLVIIQTSQGFASYLLELDSTLVRSNGIVIGFDARHNSERFAQLAALAFLQKNIPVYFCDHIIPTPMIAFGVKHFGCAAGIVVTASHNPKQDNGYKVYWSNGAQILSPHDKKIQEHIVKDDNQQPWPKAWQHELFSGSQSLPTGWDDLFSRVHGDLCKNYFNYIETLVANRRERNQSSSICITYTTMHGVGHMYLSRALDIAGFEDVFPVELQKKPDPDFSTVKFPNPEESGALDLAFETAKHANSNLILANDPDSDRCAAAVYDPKTDYKRVLTGNEIGALLGWWIWHCYKNEGQEDSMSLMNSHSYIDATTSNTSLEDKRKGYGDCYMLSTAVSSKFLQSMAIAEGFNFIETLTGFKYMGNVADELSKQGKTVLFAFEEAIGYMVNSNLLDKDGISAAVELAQCAAFVATTYSRTLEQQVDWLHMTYGYHYNVNSYYLCTDQTVISTIFRKLQSNYPRDFGKEYAVVRVRDLNNGFDSGTADHKATLPCSTSSFMVTFFVGTDISLTIRTSGTEPKIKYYSEIVAKLPAARASDAVQKNDFNGDDQLKAKQAAQNRLHSLVDAAIEYCLEPSRYGLEPAD